MTQRPRIAIAHEWIAGPAGSEQTFLALAEAFPRADLYCLSAESGVVELMGFDRGIHFSKLLNRDFLRGNREVTLPLMPLAWARLGRGQEYDIVITSSHAFARYFWPAKSGLHVSYLHAPMRYAWSPDIDPRLKNALFGSGRTVLPLMRALDRRSMQWTDEVLVNSSEIAARVLDAYGRRATVLHPPVDLPEVKPALASRRSGLVCVGRYIQYKRHDLAIEVAERVGRPITLVGLDGPTRPTIQRLADNASVPVTVEVGVTKAELRTIYGRAEALIFPQREDFGLVPIEAMAQGTPVVGVALGGTAETVVDGVTGVLSDSSDVAALAAATSKVLAADIDRASCQTHAYSFAKTEFIDQIQRLVGAAYERRSAPRSDASQFRRSRDSR